MEQNQSGLKNPFLSQLVNSISSKLPYQKQEYKDDAVNPYFKTFHEIGTKRDERIKNRAVSTFNPDYGIDISDITADAGYFNFIYNNANNDKANRLMEYRMMGQYSDVANGLDKICDAFTVVDDKGKVVKLLIDPEVEIDSMIEGELLKEFRFIENHFNFKKKGWRYIRKVLVEAEQYFENIISKDRPDLGIIGMVEIPNQLIDPIYDNVQNMCIKGFVLKKFEYDAKTRSHDVKLVPLEKNQVTYINSDMFNETNSIRLPFLENARRAFRQLTMIEDAIIIYRMVRAPERIKYGVEVGNMPKPQTEAYLRGLMQKHWSKKTYDLSSQSTGTGITNVYNPQSQLDAYWIPMRDGQPQMTVDVIPGGCLAMDTKIPLLDGRILTLEEMTKEFNEGKETWIYSTNPDNGEIVPGLVSWAGVTQESADVLELELDNGKKLICTPDHKFPIIGKGFVEAKDLLVGESMIPFYTKKEKVNKRSGTYEKIYQNDKKEWQFTHKMVSENIKLDDFVYSDAVGGWKIVHHVDFNRYNNSPKNLVNMDGVDHIKYHADNCYYNIKSDEEIQKILAVRGEKSKKMWENFTSDERKELCDKFSVSAKNHINTLTKEELEIRNSISSENLQKANIKLKELFNDDIYMEQKSIKAKKAWNDLKIQNPEKCAEHGRKISEHAKKRMQNPEYKEKINGNQRIKNDKVILDYVITLVKGKSYHDISKVEIVESINNNEEILSHFLKINEKTKCRGWKNNKYHVNHLLSLVKMFGYKSWLQFRKEYEFFNHKIVSITKLDKKIQVGTLTIDQEEKYHNYHTFALDCGIFTKNSNLGKMEDLTYFQKKLYEALKIPANRLDPESSFSDGAEINRQELEFANFIIRLQNYFAEGLKQTFITHLKLRGLWEQYQLHENDFEVKFNEPTHFFELSNQQIKEIRYNNFNTLVANPHFSPTHLMKVELKMTDQEILINRKHRKLDAALEWEISQIIASGPDFREQAENAGGGEGGPPMGGGGPGGGSSMPMGGDIGGEDSSGPGGGDINSPPEFGGGDVPEGATTTPEKPSNNK